MRKRKLIAVLLACVFLFAGCSNAQPASELPLPENFLLPQKQIYGFGEATHGSAEFTLARQNIFEYLVKEHGVHAFCLETDFGGGQMINDLLYGESWNSKNTTKMLSSWIYGHQEMQNLMQWLRDYNSTVPTNEAVRFYGFDCQQWDKGKWVLQSYLDSVAPTLSSMLNDTPLSTMSDASMPKQEAEAFIVALEMMDALVADMEANKQQYCDVSEEREYDIALQTAKSMRICLRMQQAAPDADRILDANVTEEEMERILAHSLAAGNMRDAFMAEHIAWILAHEEKYYGKDSIFITGHNAHITKENYSSDDLMLGELLRMNYGGAYYAIGSDFAGGWVKAVELGGRGNLKAFQLEDGPLADRFAVTEGAILFLSNDDSPGIDAAYFTNLQRMHAIGAVFSEELRNMPDSYLQDVIPGECYDAVLLFKSIHAFHSSY